MNRTNYSEKREAVYRAICSTKTHPDAEWIYQRVKTEFPNISLGTVYRNITTLRNEGKIISLGVVKGCERFDGDVSEHSHFICTECGRIIDIERSFALRLTELEELARNELKAEIHGHSLVFYGRCGECADALLD